MIAPRFTIAVVAHQTEPYLPTALASIATQTISDFECLLLVEESTDQSLTICREMERKDSRFRAISLKKTGSASSSRNYAIDHAAGKYLVFVDGDDWILPDLLESAAGLLAKCGDVDVLQFAGRELFEEADGSFSSGRHLANLPTSEAGKVMTGQEMILKTGASGVFFGGTVINICRTRFLREHGLYQNVGLRMEDFEWVQRCWFLAERFVYLEKELYIYRRRQNSVTRRKTPRLLLDTVQEFSFVPSFIRENKVPFSIQQVWANKWFSLLFEMFFHSRNDIRLTGADRRCAQILLLTPENLDTLKQFGRLATLPKRIGMALFLLSRFTGLWLPMVYFRAFYYPLIEWRDAR